MIKINFIRNNQILKNTSIMIVAALIGGGCNYLFQIFMGRTLGPIEYGVFGSLFALFYIIDIMTATVQTSGSKFVSKFIGEGKPKKIQYFMIDFLKRMFILGIIISSIIVLLSGFISSFLKINSVIPVLILASVFLISTLLPVNLGIIQGLQKFIALGSTRIINFSSKLIFGIILVTIGFGVNGALGAVAIGSAIALFVSFIPLRSYLSRDKTDKTDFKTKEVFLYSLPTILAMFCFAVPANFDVIIAKHVFAQQTAGLYSAVSVLGKIILFIPLAVAVVMFPNVSKMHAEQKNTNRLLHICLLYTVIVSGLIATIYWFFPMIVVKIPFGIEYLAIAPIVQIYGLAMFFFSLTVILIWYCLAIDFFKYVYLLAIFTLFEIIMLSIFNNSMMEMAKVLLFINIILLTIGYSYVYLHKKSLKNRI